MRARLGHPTGKLDRGVGAFAEMLRPSRIEQLATDSREVDAVFEFAGIEKPEESPHGVHDAALERVRTAYGSTTLKRTETTKIAVWDSADFLGFAPP